MRGAFIAQAAYAPECRSGRSAKRCGGGNCTREAALILRGYHSHNVVLAVSISASDWSVEIALLELVHT
jgi:hypothetical protein